LGDGTKINKNKPIKIKIPKDKKVVSIKAGRYHALALMQNGQVLSWGRNNHGQLGDGTNKDRLEPKIIEELGLIKAIAAGGDHSLAVIKNGQMKVWGRNDFGQLGDGTKKDENKPFHLNYSKIASVIAIDVGFDHSIALL
jgi:alpha-tubulin suppressor-like RCC1 family protein